MNRRVEIRVDRLVLRGIPAAQRRFVREAVERELARIGAQGEITAGRPIQVPEISLPPGGALS